MSESLIRRVLSSIGHLISPLLVDIKNKDNRGFVLGFLAMSALFLCYVLFGKHPFLKHGGYGLVGSNPYIRYVGWFLSAFFLLFVVPVVFIAAHPKLKLKEFGLGVGDFRYSLKMFALLGGIMVAIVALLVIFKTTKFLRYYPMYARYFSMAQAKDFLQWFVILEFCYLLYFVGWEFFFRGLLIFPLEKKFGNLAALFGVLPFAIMHIGKPPVEAFGSIVAAYFLGMLAIRTRSFWICAVIHFFVAFFMDLAAALSRGLL